VGYAQDTLNPICIGNINESFSLINEGYPLTNNLTGFNCQNFNGAMDEVAVYTNALSAADVLKHYQDATASNHTLYTNDVLSAAPIVYLRMDEPTNTPPPADFSTYPQAVSYGSMAGANGLIQPGSIPGISGPVVSGFGTQSSAVQLNGFDAGIDVGNGALFGTALDPQGSQAFSVTYWFKANPSDSYGRFQTILGRGDQGWRSSMDNSGRLRWNPGAGPELRTTNRNYNDGVWHQFVGVSDGTTASLYVDAQPIAIRGGVGVLAGASLDLLIGGAPDYTTSSKDQSRQRYFAGQIAQVAFFNTALTGPQIQTLYLAAEVGAFIAQQPQNITIGLGSTASLNATAGGNPTLAYQWYQGTNTLTDSGNISGSTTSSLTFNSAVTNNAGTYFVVVTNSFGATTSQVAAVTVSLAPNILSQPSPLTNTLYVGNEVGYSVAVVGANPISYQWYHGNTPIGGATTSNLVVTAAPGTDSYKVVLNNSYGSATSAVVSVVGSVFVPPATGGFTLNFAATPNGNAAQVYVGQGAYSDSTNNVWNPIGNSGASTGFALTSSSNRTLVSAVLIYGFNNGAANAAITNGNPSWLVSYEDAVNSGSPGIGGAGGPEGQFTIQNVPKGSYLLYLYGQNYDGNRGSVFTLGPANGGVPDNGIFITTNAQPAATPAVLTEGDNYVFFRGVTPDPFGNITVDYIPNPNGTLTGEAPFNGLQLVLPLLSVRPAGNGNITITWSGGTLVSSSQLAGPYNPVVGTSPLTTSAQGPVQYFRLQE
jgi:hypothetical protein